ncbi:unnamed protein product [Symbiodinium necroappetens]|uniref:Uncharacterized protein n=1 Tax=Symbiodinium necroappetens TaxID=1628268 RepID=A0A812WT82_9DINO|nr:unnamed protein product [Symbiodinium necroappetens]
MGAYHESLPRAVPAASLGNPTVLPPAPPKAGGVSLREGPGGRGNQGEERLQAIFAKAKAPSLTPHDKAVLEEGRLWTLYGPEPTKGEGFPPFMAGQDRVAFTSQDLVLKLSEQPQQQELTYASLLPGIAAPVFWVEDVEVVLHDDKGGEQRLPMTLLCQTPVVKAADVMEQRGATFSFKFLCHVGCVLTWLWTQNLHLLDLGESNMGMETSSTAEPYPALRYFDLLSWRRQAKPDAKWHGYHKLAQKMCPMHANWIRTVCSEVTQDAPKVFRRLASECQGYVDRLNQAGVMVEGELSPRQIFLNRG